jgi:porphobilinogen synthase
MRAQINSNYGLLGGSGYPFVRLRRLRKNKAIRELLQETRLSVKDFICPVFVQSGLKEPKNISSMQDVKRLPLSKITDEVDSILKLGINSVILFGIESDKDDKANAASSEKGIIQKTIKNIRSNFGEKVVVISDVCMCQYTPKGHCGIIKNEKIDNDQTNVALSKIAESHAAAGTDIVAPSSMMDGQVSAIRHELDEKGYFDTSILAYSAKLASPLYTPFRDLAGSYPEFGDRKTYQMPFTNPKEAIREIEMDINEGADMIMVKPAIPYLDLIYQARKSFKLPLCAFSVSGEYALIKAASEQGWINEIDVMTEFLTSIKRAGADIIITYHAKKMASVLNNK